MAKREILQFKLAKVAFGMPPRTVLVTGRSAGFICPLERGSVEPVLERLVESVSATAGKRLKSPPDVPVHPSL